ncbi:MAG: hypothetical protein IKJ15_07850 [Lachnospiraceae bacterium]|nr:hypothetical protein [Lachnospiraceae bacterium]
MKKYLLTTLLLLALIMTMIACGKSEEAEANTNTDVENTEDVSANADVQSDNEENTSNDTVSDTPSVTYEGIDFNSTLPGREWVQTTFPGVINEPKIVIFNDETNKKKIVENGEIILFDEADTFAMFFPEGTFIYEGCNLLDKVTTYACCAEVTFDMETLKKEYLFWKDIDGGAQYKVLLDNNGIKQELMCMISLGY